MQIGRDRNESQDFAALFKICAIFGGIWKSNRESIISSAHARDVFLKVSFALSAARQSKEKHVR